MDHVDPSTWFTDDELDLCSSCGERKVPPPPPGEGSAPRVCLGCGNLQKTRHSET
jgi:hypothetical protein